MEELFFFVTGMGSRRKFSRYGVLSGRGPRIRQVVVCV